MTPHYAPLPAAERPDGSRMTLPLYPTQMKHPVLDQTRRLRQQADRFGFECMATEWRGRNEPHLFRCAAGHGFLLTASALERKGSGDCAMCEAARCLRQLQQRAERNGVRCLSTEWTGTAGPYLFECAQGHQWQRGARPTPGCPQCGDQGSALARRVLSKVYVNSRTKQTWLCDRGHEWWAVLTSVRHQGTWCPQCRNMSMITNRKSKARAKYEVAG